MTLQDFIKEEDNKSYNSKEVFWFENKKVGFWYKIYLTSYTYQPDWGGRWETKYQVLIVVDEKSIHPNHSLSNNVWDKIRFGFFLKETIKRGEFNEKDMEKILNSALKLKIENKIKVDNYQKILGIVNGTSFYH